MKNVTFLGLCWAMTLGLVAVALGQQAPTGQYVPPGQPKANGQNQQWDVSNPQPKALGQQSTADQPPAMPAPAGPQDRSMLSGAASSGQPRGELGVWLVASGGPGVAVQRITRDSAAQKAGLREGDIILQVNGRGASSPQAAAQMIKQIPIGQMGTLTIWRDGDQQQLQVTMQAAREPARDMAREMNGEMPRDMANERHQVGFGGTDLASGDLAARTMKLEQQINSLTQELQQLRQELTQLRSAAPAQPGGLGTEPAQSTPPPAATQTETKSGAATLAPPPAPTNTTAPPPGFGKTEEKATPPATEPPKPATPPAATEPFGATPPAPGPGKTEIKEKTDEKKAGSDKGGTDDLFK